MENGLTADDVRLLSAWAASTEESPGTTGSGSASDGSSEAVAVDLELFLGMADDDEREMAAADAPRRTRKKRRATYVRNREERESLQDEIAALESRLAVLKKRAGIAEGASGMGLEAKAVNNAVLRGMIHQQQMVLANAQSMMAKSVNVQGSHPLYTPVHMGKDWKSRRQTMMSLKEAKLRSAFQYLTERSRHHDELLPHSSQEVSQDQDGNIICTQFDIMQFAGVRSLRQVFDAVHYFFINEEMVLSERLSHIAIRDDYDVVDGVAVNSRMYWIDSNGIMTEWSAVSFAQLFDDDAGLDGCRCGVLMTDNVDSDALYPYKSADRVRKDLSGAILLTVGPSNSSSPDDGELVVIMRRAAIIKLHHPQFPLVVAAKEGLIKGVFSWTQAMSDTIRAQLSHPRPTAS